MKKYLSLFIFSMILISCDHDPYYWYDDTSPQPSYFTLSTKIVDTAAQQPLSGIKVMMKPDNWRDTLVKFSNASGVCSFLYKRFYGSSALIMFRDTSGTYAPLDTLLLFSGRDFHAGLKEIHVNL